MPRPLLFCGLISALALTLYAISIDSLFGVVINAGLAGYWDYELTHRHRRRTRP